MLRERERPYVLANRLQNHNHRSVFALRTRKRDSDKFDIHGFGPADRRLLSVPKSDLCRMLLTPENKRSLCTNRNVSLWLRFRRSLVAPLPMEVSGMVDLECPENKNASSEAFHSDYKVRLQPSCVAEQAKRAWRLCNVTRCCSRSGCKGRI